MTRIVIDPDSLRSTARGLNEAASEYGLLARAIGGEDQYLLAPDVQGLAASITSQARSELVRVSTELASSADEIRRRAAFAEVLSPFGVALPRVAGLMESVGNAAERWSTGVLSFLRRYGTYDQVQDYAKILGHLDLARELLGLSAAKLAQAGKGPIRVGWLARIGAGWDAAKLGGHFAVGDWANFSWDAAHLGDDILAAVSPHYALVSGAFRTGWEVGMWIDEQTNFGIHAAGHIFDDAIDARFGGKTARELTPAEAAELTHRYEGLSGFKNFGQDAVGLVGKSAAQGATSFLRRIF
jgi:hypothetical protein